ncbi:MAG: histidine kinase [Eubacteriales bacterium]|nr:histidine kinase [Eubacteriales bacterium]
MRHIILFQSQRLKKWFSNLPLQYKIQLISIGCLLTITGASLLISQLVMQKYNDLLLDSVGSSLAYANNDFTRTLNNARELSYTLLADPELQRLLVQTGQVSGSTEAASLYTQLNSRLHSYFLEHQPDYISSISLYTSRFSCHTNSSQSRLLSDERIQEILEAAHQNSGSAVWLTDGLNGNSLLLAREIRRYSDLSLVPLGTVLISINLDKMVQNCPMFSSYDSFFYQLQDADGDMLYDSSGQKLLPVKSSRQTEVPGQSQLTKRNGHWYLSLSGPLSFDGWTYTCLVSYDGIRATLHGWRLLSLLLLLCCCLLLTLASRRIIRSLTSHFAALIDKMKHFASSPDTPADRLPDTGYDYENRRDEIGLLHRQFDHMARQISDLIASNYTNELLIKDAQLKALEMQINPHFLYNTLEAINWRAKAIGASAISLMVESLGKLFRAVLGRSGESFTIAEELSLVDSYLNIQQCRFGSRLICLTHTDPDPMSVS